ncbi:MAG: InlB B-repeat-containing protein [Candidatus Peribacteria bacterium]|nr:InlB B-repeat-containing protein [Candidatus Peribacteria bacterium]
MTVRADWSTGSHPSVMCASTPTKTGYIFNGWYTAVSA